MFRFFSFANSAHLNELLDQPHPNIEEILDEECVVNEARSSSHKLMAFLCRKETFDSLISYVTEIPHDMPYDPTDAKIDEKLNKFPYVACEILSLENDTLARYFLGLISDDKLRDIDSDTIPDTDFERADSMNIENVKDLNDFKDPHDNNINEDTQMEIELLPPVIKFLRFINSQPPINYTIAGYFCKVIRNLFTFKPANLSGLLYEAHFKYLQRMALNLYSDSIQELFLLILKLDCPYFKTDTKEYYVDQRTKLVQQLILNLFEKPSEHYDENLFLDLQNNSSSTLIQLLANVECIVAGHEIISPLLHPEVLNKIFDGIGNPSLAGPLTPLLAQLCEYQSHVFAPKQGMSLLDLSNYTEPVNQSEIPENNPFLISTINSIDSIINLLKADNKDVNPNEVTFQYGKRGYYFGKTRLGLLDLLLSYVKLQNEKLSAKMISSGLLNVLLDLYVKNPWSNIVHTSLSKIFDFILIHGPESLIRGLFEQARILDFILESLKNNEFTINSKMSGKIGKGYIAYIHRLAMTIEEENKFAFVREYCNNHKGWQAFKNSELKDVNDKLNMKLGGEDIGNSQTLSFSGFPRTTLYNGEIIGESDYNNHHNNDNDLAHCEDSDEEIKLDSEDLAVKHEEDEDNLVNSYNNEHHDDIAESPTNHAEFIDADIQERHSSEVKYPQSVLIKKLLTNEPQDDVLVNQTAGQMEAEIHSPSSRVNDNNQSTKAD
jgi:hypothetical protein